MKRMIPEIRIFHTGIKYLLFLLMEKGTISILKSQRGDLFFGVMW